MSSERELRGRIALLEARCAAAYQAVGVLSSGAYVAEDRAIIPLLDALCEDSAPGSDEYLLPEFKAETNRLLPIHCKPHPLRTLLAEVREFLDALPEEVENVGPLLERVDAALRSGG